MCKAIEELCKEASAKAYKEGFKQGFKEGYKLGLTKVWEERAIEIARDLLQIEKMPPEQVAEFVCLPLEKVLTLC